MTDFVHEAAIELADGADPRAPGGAITVALCGHWEHEPPCRWPHHWIVEALQSGQQAGPDGQVSRWTVRKAPTA